MAENNGLSLQKAAQSLTKGELAGYRMDLEEFRHRSQMAGLLTDQMEKELDNASRAVRISRLQATKDSLRREMQLFYGKYDQDLSDHLKKQFTDTYAAAISQLGLRSVLKLPGIDADLSRLDAVIRKPWAVDGLTFSQRLWKDQSLVVNTLHQTLTRQVALSLPPDEAVKALVTAFPEKSMRSAIGRLVMTESNAIATAGNREAYKATGVKQYEIVATLDSHTSAICQEMDGKRFPISKMEVGVTAPPFHPWCRTTTAPYDPDFEGILPPEKRAARDGDGKTYLTGAKNYKEWVDVSSDNGYNKDNKRIIDLQFFGDPGFSRQTDKQLEKSIRSLKKNIALHQQKQQNPNKYCPGWDGKSKKEKEGLLWYWEKEIRRYEKQVLQAEEEMKRRDGGGGVNR